MIYPPFYKWNYERACWTVGETEDYWVDITPMIYNHRVVMTPKRDPSGYVVGWCYPNMELAYLAVQEWDPIESWKPDPNIHNFRPTGFIKEVGL